jgi:xanthine dehydrogenase/oxidase
LPIGCAPLAQEDGGLQVYVSSQWLDYVRAGVCAVTSLPANKVKVAMKRAGGAYGAKITRPWLGAAAVSFAAQSLKCPVRMTMSLNTNMRFIGKRHPFRGDYTVGLKQGLLHAVKATWYMDTGSQQRGGFVVYVWDGCV